MEGVIGRLRRFLPVLPTTLARLLTASVRQNERHLSASARHQPTPLRVFLPVLPTKLALLLTSSVRQNERHY